VSDRSGAVEGDLVAAGMGRDYTHGGAPCKGDGTKLFFDDVALGSTKTATCTEVHFPDFLQRFR
jgi:hypothetical protein